MESAAKRPWYRLHWGTVFTVFFVGMGWLGNGFYGVIDTLLGVVDTSDHGWPFACVAVRDGSPTIIHPAAFAFDAGLMLACLIAVAAVVERLGEVRCRFSLAALISLVTTIAVLLAFWRWETEVGWFVIPGFGEYQSLEFVWWESSVPMLFGIWSAVYVTVRLALCAASWFLARLRRPAPAIEADGSPAQ